MAKVDFNARSLLIHGKTGRIVWRRSIRGLSAYPLPDYSKRKPTAKQKVENQRFKRRAPVAHALLADPKQRAKCLRLAEERHMQVWNAAISIASKLVN